jgi:methionyl-tRNA formyltransferase
MINRCILVSEKSWHKDLFNKLKKDFKKINWVHIDNKLDFNEIYISKLNPDRIFIPHWSYIIDKSIFNKFECIVFHMTDLPYGRGGSPLQNLIIRGQKTTKISAIKVSNGIDTGDVYLKSELDLSGSAIEIFIRSSLVICNMISEILTTNPKPIPQTGKITNFKRRSPSQGSIINLKKLNEVYDFIRMLDCDGYPRAFVETQSMKFEFSNAKFDKNNNLINANVRIFKK